MLCMFSSRLSSFVVVLAATAVLAADRAGANDVRVARLDCPQGTTQRVRGISYDESTFCVRVAVAKGGEPQLHGPYVDFYPNGQKQSEGQYLDGYRVGRWTFWNANGSKSGSTDFSGGNYHGEKVQYFPNGTPRSIEQYANGKRHGLVQEFSEDGKMIRKIQYVDDKQVAVK